MNPYRDEYTFEIRWISLIELKVECYGSDESILKVINAAVKFCWK